MFYTAQYRYPGHDRLDITVKGNDITGKLYAPTWEIVGGVKNGTITEEEYTNKYYDMLCERHNNSNRVMEQTKRLVSRIVGNTETNTLPRDITLVCFCAFGQFCHRYLLVKWLVHNFNLKEFYGGERVEQKGGVWTIIK